MKNILFDMDGTLYSFENGEYKGSKLEKEVQLNVLKYLEILEGNNFLQKFEEIKLNYGEDFSIAFEELYKIEKIDYFNKIWDINPEGFIKNDRKVRDVFNFLKINGYYIYIVSEAPIIWINKVLNFLKVDLLISGIYSGQSNERKSNGLLYKKIKSQLRNDMFMVGDQISLDIIKAKENGFKTIFISGGGEFSNDADYSVSELLEVCGIVKGNIAY